METEHKVIVRLRTTVWANSKGLYTKRSLTYLRKQCVGHNWLEEDVSCIGAEQVVPNIINLDTCIDGIYEVVMCNVRTDTETGYAEDWNYKLVPVIHNTANVTP